MRFNIGDMVRIGKKSEYYGEDSESNPKDQDGIVVRIYGRNTRIQVRWLHSYRTNGYPEEDLKLRKRA